MFLYVFLLQCLISVPPPRERSFNESLYVYAITLLVESNAHNGIHLRRKSVPRVSGSLLYLPALKSPGRACVCTATRRPSTSSSKFIGCYCARCRDLHYLSETSVCLSDTCVSKCTSCLNNLRAKGY